MGARPIEGLIDERRDEFRTPFHSWKHKEFFMPGVEVHATQALNLIRGDALRRASEGRENFYFLLAALVFGGGLIWLRPVPATLAAIFWGERSCWAWRWRVSRGADGFPGW